MSQGGELDSKSGWRGSIPWLVSKMNLVCFDPHAGALRRYVRGDKGPQCTGQALYDPWKDLPESERTVSVEDIEAFRMCQSTGGRVPQAA